MRNIWMVFLSDCRKLSKNVVAMVIIIGLVILPSLYAWFNIFSNWDPYGNDATSMMKVSVFSEDEGADLSGLSLNVGEKILGALEANDMINWTICTSKEEAVEGVKSGDCYAALIVTKDFSKNLLAFLTGDPVKPVIRYYQNGKKNAIATKITSKVENTIQNKIATTFVATIGEYLSKFAGLLTGKDNLAETLKDDSAGKSDDLQSSLDSLVILLNSFKTLAASTGGTVETAESILPALDASVRAAKEEAAVVKDGLKISRSTVKSVKSLIDGAFDTLIAEVNALTAQASLLSANIDKEQIKKAIDSFQTKFEKDLTPVKEFDLGDKEIVIEVETHYEILLEELEKFKGAASLAVDDVEALKDLLETESAALITALYEAKSSFDEKAASVIGKVIKSLGKVVSEAQSALAEAEGLLPGFSEKLSGLKETLDSGAGSMDEAIAYVNSLKSKIASLDRTINEITSSKSYRNLEELLSSDPERVLEFLESPVSLDEVAFYEIETYGSAMAPFYTVLALWIGALILVAILKVRVKDEPEFLAANVKPWQKFFGRYLTVFVIGQAQTLLCVLGNLIYIGIQCRQPVLFVLASVVTSFAFTALMYSLTVAFGNIGQAIAVIVLVLQVAGSGGTFPVQVLPPLYQAIYKALPFTYSLDAMRECVGGLYGLDYLKDLGILMLYVVLALLIAALLIKPFKKLNRKMDQSKEKSGIML